MNQKAQETRDLLWLFEAIMRANSIERLEFLGDLIADDTADGEPYTRDEDTMKSLRAKWAARAREVG